MTAWTAIWGPGPGRLRWELTVTNEAGDIAMQMRSAALYAAPRPGDGVLEAIGLETLGDWREAECGSFRCPVAADAQREAALVQGLLAAQRSDPGTRVH